MQDGKNIVIALLSLILLVFVLKDCENTNSVELSDTAPLERIIADQQKIIDEQKSIIYQIQAQRDTLFFIETEIKYKYRDRYEFVNTATLNALDSVIRLNAYLQQADSLKLKDSIKCYSKEELLLIGTRLIRANECDTLLKLSEQDRLYANQIIDHQDSIIASKDTQLVAFDNIVLLKNADIASLQEELFHDSRKAKWLKLGWLGTSGVLGTLLAIQLLK